MPFLTYHRLNSRDACQPSHHWGDDCLGRGSHVRGSMAIQPGRLDVLVSGDWHKLTIRSKVGNTVKLFRVVAIGVEGDYPLT
jgi:hypothetical protein